jgi:hypothetical protein
LRDAQNTQGISSQTRVLSFCSLSMYPTIGCFVPSEHARSLAKCGGTAES